MCLPDFIEFKQIKKNNPLIGYRSWLNPIENSLNLRSMNQDYIWKPNEGPYKVIATDSGLYSYSNYNYYNYYILGIIHQYGRTAIHKTGYRSQYAKIITLFTIRETDAVGGQEFLGWIKVFNVRIIDISKKYKCNTIHYQDFVESMKVE